MAHYIITTLTIHATKHAFKNEICRILLRVSSTYMQISRQCDVAHVDGPGTVTVGSIHRDLDNLREKSRISLKPPVERDLRTTLEIKVNDLPNIAFPQVQMVPTKTVFTNVFSTLNYIWVSDK